jgi:tRNA dimethylallyltransferase
MAEEDRRNKMHPHLLVIVGPTAVGKTALSLQLAAQFQGEILSGDSMQVYRQMDIGTAKASPAERARIPHHLIDIIDPDTPFSVQQLAQAKIEEIHLRCHLPILVGGTGLYVESITHRYVLPHVPEKAEIRKRWQAYAQTHGKEALHAQLHQVDPLSARRLHPHDQRRIIRALEVTEITGIPFSQLKRRAVSPYRLLWIGLTMPRELLYERINQRVDEMIAAGLVAEVTSLREKGFHSGLTAMQAIGYKEMMSYLEGEISLLEAIAWIKKRTRHFAKRQLAWFRRLPEINWFDVTEEGVFAEIARWVAGKFSCDGE